VPKLRIKDYLNRYLEFLVIKVKVIITKSITLISPLYSYSLDVGLIVGVANYDFLIVGVFKRSRLVDYTLSYKLGVLLVLSFTILVT
jgi:hypothetical protein